MKKIFFSIVALAALAACSKSEVAYEQPSEIGFAPAVKNVTKAANTSGILNEEDKLGVWAYWNYNQETNVVSGSTGQINSSNPYSNYSTAYLENATFANRNSGPNWGGETPYPWPTNGALVFAGYTIPNNGTINATYTLNGTLAETADDDVMTFTNYTQSLNTAETYDLCWFGATASSYDKTSGVVPVTLSHALTWITFQIKGKESTSLPVTAGWKVTELVLNDIKTTGTGVCVGTTVQNGETVTPASANWTLDETKGNMPIYPLNLESGETIGAAAAEIESNAKGIVILPQVPTSVTVEWEYSVGTKIFTEKKNLPLKLSDNVEQNKWLAGVHYTYTLVFDSNEILIAPTYSGWDTASQEVTVE